MCCDMKVQCKNTCFQVHEFLLKQRLPQLFQKYLYFLQKKYMIVSDMTPHTLRLLIEYAYTVAEISIESQASISSLEQYLEMLNVCQFHFGPVCHLELAREIRHVNEYVGSNVHHQVCCIHLHFAYPYFQVDGYEFAVRCSSSSQQQQQQNITVNIQSRNVFKPTTFYGFIYSGNDNIVSL